MTAVVDARSSEVRDRGGVKAMVWGLCTHAAGVQNPEAAVLLHPVYNVNSVFVNTEIYRVSFLSHANSKLVKSEITTETPTFFIQILTIFKLIKFVNFNEF